MSKPIRIVRLPRKAGVPASTRRFGVENARKVNAFHRSFPEYSVTPLAELPNLAQRLGVAGLYVKDESYRFGLNAFKVLGGSYAIGRYIAQYLGMDLVDLPCKKMLSDEIRAKLGEITFVTATDGNHGRGVAWTANRLRQKSVVYMPKGTAPERLANIRALGSDASITEFNYDDAVRLSRKNAEEYGWVVVQDTAWEGYETVPGWIMEGYATMALEAAEQLRGEKPTHIFLQAGVGAMAGSLAGFFADLYGEERPVVTIVEPHAADCLFRTAEASDGALHSVGGDLKTIMAGLACGEPCSLAWDVLKDCADFFVSMPDEIAARGMRVLGNPLPGDTRVVSGESGASGFGFALEAMTDENLRAQLGINEHSRILCFSTEGDTDRENYRRIVWDGLYATDGKESLV